MMDGPGLGDPLLQARVLSDLARVNYLTRTHAPVLQFLRQAWARHPVGQTVSVLDVGSGQGDLLRAVYRLALQLHRPVLLAGLDIHADSTRAARQNTPAAMGIRYQTGDVFTHEPGPTDYVISSQLAHHLDDPGLLAFLAWQQRHARVGWCIADLRRHWFPYLGFRWLARAAGWHRVVRLDGTQSIARACTLAEWEVLLTRAGVTARVSSHWPFRLTVQALRPAEPESPGTSTETSANPAANPAVP